MRQALVVFVFALAGPVLAQDPGLQETRFHRIHLHNGNFIDGAFVKQTDQELILKIKGGEIGIRLDLIARVEIVRMRSVNEAPEEAPFAKPKPPVETPDPFAGLPAPSPADSLPAPRVAAQARPASELFQAGGDIKRRIDLILQSFEAADIEQKGAVVKQLVDAEGETAPYLASLLEQIDREMFPHLVSALLLKKDARAIPVLALQLESFRPDVRGRAAAILGATANAAAAKHLWPLLRDGESEVRASALAALRELAPAELLPHLPILCADPNRDVRTLALAALFELSKKLGAEEKLVLTLAEALAKCGGSSCIFLIGAIAKTGRTEAGSILVPYLSADPPEIRAATAAALGSLGGAASTAGLLTRLPQEKDARVRVELARAVQRLLTLKAAGPLIEWLADPDIEVRAAALQALGTLTGKSFGADREKWAAWWAAQAKPGE